MKGHGSGKAAEKEAKRLAASIDELRRRELVFLLRRQILDCFLQIPTTGAKTPKEEHKVPGVW